MDIAIYLAIACCAASTIYTSWHWYERVRSDARDFKCIIEDIRAMNTYNSYFFAAGLVFFGLIIDKGIGIVPKSSVVLLIFAFLTASAAIFFIPLKKTSNKNCPAAKKLWLYTLLLSQFTVILTVVGVLSAVVVGFKLFS